MKSGYPLVVIGTGPAGMAAARSAAQLGLEVAVFDEQRHPGGQIYRQVDRSPLADVGLMGKEYEFGRPEVLAFRQAKIEYFADASVWYLDQGGQLGVIHQGRQYRVAAERIVIATGARERPVPFPGWELPGVMTAGAAQILLKSAAFQPTEKPVLAGSGPLLLLLAWQYLRAGIELRAIVETTPPANRWVALAHLPRAIAGSDYLIKGLRMILSLRRARVPWYRAATELRAEGGEQLQSLSFRSRGKLNRIDAGLLLIHQGLLPNLELAEAAGCEIAWHDSQQCWKAVCDTWGESSQAGVFVIGDSAAIGGARAASLSGQLAALQVACQAGSIELAERDRRARPIIAARDRHLAIRPFLDAYYRVAKSALSPTDETLVCRCEEVSAGELRRIIALGCQGPNQAKAFSRCGMGACQGRFCGATVEQIFAHETGASMNDIGRYRLRPPIKPVTLGQLAGSNGDDR